MSDFIYTGNKIIQHLVEKSGYSDCLIRNLVVKNAINGIVEFEIKVEEHHCNILGNIHGGMLASLIDWTSSIAIMSKLGNFNSGVSCDLSVNYVRPVPLGHTIK
jgi:acyl-coenzyme A thioesterase 13